MKKIIYTLALIVLISCGKEKRFTENADSIKELQTLLADEFGKDAYYTSISIINSSTSSGDIINTTQTSDPASLKMGEWNHFQGKWTQSSEVTLELSEGAKAKDFMFKLDDSVINFKLLGDLVEKSKEKVKEEKKIDEVIVSSIYMNAPNNGDFEKMEYFITIKPKNGGTSFDFWYKLDGTLRKFDY
ncbi:hypothetical protein [Tenacibaculum jejuense]|uniref:Probable lipoprotein n=1 Tax=Tenacibaculum jejuense TaxID=584609 RepID=A0A238UB15_9FLAO|nr:hypothetical protein [Tenacibaculum jejuense]SNR16265.1 Probable lipoprotein precursor [Tenacibaculum jejuense]